MYSASDRNRNFWSKRESDKIETESEETESDIKVQIKVGSTEKEQRLGGYWGYFGVVGTKTYIRVKGNFSDAGAEP